MICDVCGRNNADGLTFCQDCGRRLKAPPPRVVSPTPPSGLPKVAVPSPRPSDPIEASATANSPEQPTVRASAARLRPEAPAFTFAPTAAREVEPTPTVPKAAVMVPKPLRLPDVPAPRRQEPVSNICGNCQAENPPGYRFCVTCGTVLANGPSGSDKGALRPPAPKQSSAVTDDTQTQRMADEGAGEHQSPKTALGMGAQEEGKGTPRTPSGGVPDKIVGAPVVDIAVARQAPVRLIECGRCRGHCVAGTRYCKYCGASLEALEGRALAKALELPRELPASEPTASHEARAPQQGAKVEVTTLASPMETPSGAAVPAHIMPLRSPLVVRSPSSSPEVRVSQAAGGRLVVIIEDGSEGRSFPLANRQLDIGQTEGDIVLEDDLYVSPRHARLVPSEGGWLLRDLGSTNHIYVRIRKSYTLRDADLLLLGLEVLQFQTVSDGERGLGHAMQHGTLLFGSPAMQRRARLCQRTVEGITRDIYHLYRDETVIGRETGDIVFTADPFLSRRHAVIRRSPATGEFAITDLDSSNGTYVAIREDIKLVNGDFIRIGQHLFRVDLG